MSRQLTFRSVDAFRSAIPIHPQRSNWSSALADLAVCSWQTPWILSFEIPANDDLVIAFHRDGLCDVRALDGGGMSNESSSPGQLTMIPPERSSGFQVAGEVSFETIHVPRARIRPLAKRNALGDVTPDFRFAFHDAFVGACLEAVLGEALQPGPKSEEFIHSVTDSLLLHLLRSSSGRDGHSLRASHAIERTRSLIESSLSQGCSLEDLAEEAGVSRSHFARRFRAEMGVSPHRYQSQVRVEKAKVLLRDTRMSLVDIAMELGFCSQSHFTQVFRALAGVTPRKFRETR
jgi:AraC family transcriptional regulator